MAEHDIHLSAGEVLRDQYKIIRHIGSGGMAVVYLACELHDESKLWAVKIADTEKKMARRLSAEGKVLSRHHHKNLPQIADFFYSDDRRYVYLVQEYIKGKSLLQLFEEQDQPFSEQFVIDLGIEITDILTYLHSQKPSIIYRDIKPGNLMLTDEGRLMLIDFGIARAFDEEKLKDTLQIGTVGFAAPEQFEKRQSDTRTDLFSLGALLYFLLSGGKYVYIAQKPLKTFRKGISKTLHSIVHQLVEHEPDKRIQSASETRASLEKAKEDLLKKQKRQMSKGKLIAAYIGSSLLLLAVIVYIIIDQY
ncbi:serine/threonine-protein kinase [Alkalicoccobacillus gibsonii]|uniref:non-specific serine/threonine protein kinase n=1 Tax=Alkalicoccobacillus gibsonii TaxID=79881 RepID=A0ABU9VGW5_9BACI